MKFFCAVTFLVCCAKAFAQGTFQDLDFEEATLVVSGHGYSPASAFPGWQAFNGTTPISSVAYDAVSAGASLIGIQDDRYGYIPIQGNYTAILQGALPPNGSSVNVTLSQNGVVPSGTQSILLDATESQTASFVVTLGGQVVPLVPVQTIASYTVYEGNVSAWAGLDSTLSITEMGPANQMYSPSLLELDNISFSPNQITVTPEPDALTLMSVGGLLFGIYRPIQAARK